MYTGPNRLTRAWQKAREFPPAVQGAAVVAVMVLAAVGAARSHDGASDPGQFTGPATSAPASALDNTPSAEPLPTLDETPSADPSPSDEPTDEPTYTASPTSTPTPTDTAFMFSDCKAIKAAGRDPLSRGEYGYNPALDK